MMTIRTRTRLAGNFSFFTSPLRRAERSSWLRNHQIPLPQRDDLTRHGGDHSKLFPCNQIDALVARLRVALQHESLLVLEHLSPFLLCRLNLVSEFNPAVLLPSIKQQADHEYRGKTGNKEVLAPLIRIHVAVNVSVIETLLENNFI